MSLIVSSVTLQFIFMWTLSLSLSCDVVFSARQHICYSALYAIARPSVTRVDQSKNV